VSEVDESANPENPRCPICGAVDWFSDPRWNYVLHAVNTTTNRPIMSGSAPWVIPVEGSICRSCRFVRLRSAAGTLEFPGE